MSRLPSLSALRAFTVAGQTLNLRAAAETLHVTPSALSHLIRDIENALGQPLFQRHSKGLHLTELGQRLLPGMQSGFQQIQTSWELALQTRASRPLTISTLSTFATQWLIPKLEEFETRHPNVTVHVSTSTKLANFQHDGIDCAIRWGKGSWPQRVSEPLYFEQLTLIMAPALQKKWRMTRPDQVINLPLLQAKLNPHDWRNWFQTQGIKWQAPPGLRTFDTRALMIQAVVARLGAAVIDPVLVQHELKSGLLIAPFPASAPQATGYHLVRLPTLETDQRFQVFRQWLLEQVSTFTGGHTPSHSKLV